MSKETRDIQVKGGQVGYRADGSVRAIFGVETLIWFSRDVEVDLHLIQIISQASPDQTFTVLLESVDSGFKIGENKDEGVSFTTIEGVARIAKIERG